MKKAEVPSILVAVVLLALAVTAQAQQPKKVFRMGVLALGNSTTEDPRIEAILQSMCDFGYIKENIAIEIGSLSLLPSWCASRLMSSSHQEVTGSRGRP
jgi:hypothetical protein